ncbi:hypothetical protein BaRGS_00019542, partial [Batillaria attramentaria]
MSMDNSGYIASSSACPPGSDTMTRNGRENTCTETDGEADYSSSADTTLSQDSLDDAVELSSVDQSLQDLVNQTLSDSVFARSSDGDLDSLDDPEEERFRVSDSECGSFGNGSSVGWFQDEPLALSGGNLPDTNVPSYSKYKFSSGQLGYFDDNPFSLCCPQEHHQPCTEPEDSACMHHNAYSNLVSSRVSGTSHCHSFRSDQEDYLGDHFDSLSPKCGKDAAAVFSGVRSSAYDSTSDQVKFLLPASCASIDDVPKGRFPFDSFGAGENAQEDNLSVGTDFSDRLEQHTDIQRPPPAFGDVFGASSQSQLIPRFDSVSSSVQNEAVQDTEDACLSHNAAVSSQMREEGLKPLPSSSYNAHFAKLKASISWILTKAYGTNIPQQFKDPYYENAAGQLQIKPQLINQLTSSELYCQACSNMFSDTASQWQGHWSIIQVLSRKGIYVAEAGDAVVTETVLMQTAPFKVAAHLALIDALMKAYASEIASVERVVQAVRRFASFNASSELPSGVEEALVFWINKACTALSQRGDADIIQGESSQKVRIVSKTTPREPKTIPKMEDLMSDLGDGCSVAATISFYQPNALPVAEVCLKECVGIADSLFNLRLIRTFCERHLVLKCFHFTYEDLLYGRENLHENVLVFVAELFFLLEASEQGEEQKENSPEGTAQVSVRRLPSPSVPISNVTKRSFQKMSDDGRHHTERLSASPSTLSSRQPLLQKRVTGRHGQDTVTESTQRPSRRTHSLSSPQERETIRHSVQAWRDDQDIRDRGSQSSNLLENVSMDWEADIQDDVDPVSSVDIAEFESANRRQANLTDPHHPDYMEVVSVGSGQASAMTARSQASTAGSDRHEPLMPAKLRPAKEKINNFSKAEERGDRTPRRKVVSPTKMVKGKTSPPGNGGQIRAPTTSVADRAESGSHHSSGSSMDEIIVTPLASADLAASHSVDTVTSDSDASLPQQQELQAQRTGFEAFMIPPDSSTEVRLPTPRRGGGGSSTEPPATSYTLESAVHDSQSAREAGLPVIGQSASDFLADGDVGFRLTRTSREGSIGSSRSSGDFSDHESHKIHQDHKARESLKISPRHPSHLHKPLQQPPPQLVPLSSSPLITDHLPKQQGVAETQKKPGTTSFAEIRRLKGLGSVDNSGVVYMQHGQDQGGGDASGHQNRLTLKSAFLQKQDSGKKATFAQLPNETTWQQNAQRSAAQGPSTSSAGEAAASNGEAGAERPATSELSQLRMKLEEKRREIERKKQRQEVQHAKMRQRLGKAAFMRVISKQGEEAGPAGGLMSQRDVPAFGGGRDITDSAPRNILPSHPLTQERLGQVRPVPEAQEEVSRPTSLQTTVLTSPPTSGSTSASESPSGRPFSRDGIQQTIDGVRRRWFHGSDPEGEMIRERRLSEDERTGPFVSDLGDDMVRSSPPNIAAAVFGLAPRPTSALAQEACQPPAAPAPDMGMGYVGGEGATPRGAQVREASQSPRVTPERRESSGSGEQEPYDSSLDRLNRSLTELQGEIKRLTLQQEQFQDADVTSQDDDSSSGFFVSFGDDPPRRPRPKLSKERDATKKEGSDGSSVGVEEPKHVPPLHGGGAAVGGDIMGSDHSGSHHSIHSGSDDSSPGVGFMTRDLEMQKKKERLIQQQLRRKEEQERRRLEKEMEAARKQEQKMMKEEEMERKKAEEKARREAIFQQYLQKKMEDEEKSPPSAAVQRRDHASRGQPRPKSMFAKARPQAPEFEGVRAGSAASHSSQEDLSVHASPPGSTAPPSPFRLKPNTRGKMRKAVSCNTLTQNGNQGASTYRRPPSPDLYRLRRGGPRSHDSSSDTGSHTGSHSGSNASEYTGPKLFVKPSAKSNRHIIINAISHCCLAGCVNTDMKNKVLEEIARSAAKHFLILFRDHGCQYRGLYSFDPDGDEAYKIIGTGPRQIASNMVERFY